MKKLYRVSLVAFLSTFGSHFSYAQTCETSSKLSAPLIRYQIVSGSNGAEVLDKRTGLVWQRCSMGQVWNGSTCIGNITRHTWADALKQAQKVGGGYRLPNIKDLQTLVEDSCNDPAINQMIFPKTDTYSIYLSSSIFSKDKTKSDNSAVWKVSFTRGSVASSVYKSDRSFNVRLVRNNK